MAATDPIRQKIAGYLTAAQASHSGTSLTARELRDEDPAVSPADDDIDVAAAMVGVRPEAISPQTAADVSGSVQGQSRLSASVTATVSAWFLPSHMRRRLPVIGLPRIR